MTPLHCVFLQILLAMRANVEDCGMKGDCTPLMEAASAGHTDIVRLLIAHRADVNAQSSSGNTPLIYACARGHEEVVRVLLEAGAHVEVCSKLLTLNIINPTHYVQCSADLTHVPGSQ